MNAQFWRGKRVFVTGHTGFKGAWLSLWLQKSGATVSGYALPAAPTASLYELASVGAGMESAYGDIRDADRLLSVLARFDPDIVFHLAAQSLVRVSYAEPLATYQVNVMGTVHLLEAVRRSASCRAVVIVTSDKCYENREHAWGYRESDALGGHDPYSSSKACAELVTSAYRRSFFQPLTGRTVALASARAGNVIGGGDFARDRLVPDLMAAIRARAPLRVRYPDAVRPWQHVLEPLSGYLLLAEKLWSDPQQYSQSWNFGPPPEDARTVRWVVERLSELWGTGLSWTTDGAPNVHESELLMLDSTKARTALGWQPRWTLERALRSIVDWYRARERQESLRDAVMQDIAWYETPAGTQRVPHRTSAVGVSLGSGHP